MGNNRETLNDRFQIEFKKLPFLSIISKRIYYWSPWMISPSIILYCCWKVDIKTLLRHWAKSLMVDLQVSEVDGETKNIYS